MSTDTNRPHYANKLTKHCPVNQCPNYCQNNQVMCKSHWYKVPADLRDMVWSHYRACPGSSAHLSVVRAAIKSVSDASK